MVDEYGETIPKVIDDIKEGKTKNSHETYNKIVEYLIEPWKLIYRRRTLTKSTHWNIDLRHKWIEMRKDRRRAVKMDLPTDWKQ